jgi:hypothetical protein
MCNTREQCKIGFSNTKREIGAMNITDLCQALASLKDDRADSTTRINRTIKSVVGRRIGIMYAPRWTVIA